MWAKEIQEYFNNNFEGDLKVFTERFGDLHKIYWIIDVADVAALDRLNAQMDADEEYQKLAAKHVEFFIEGSWRDLLLQTI